MPGFMTMNVAMNVSMPMQMVGTIAMETARYQVISVVNCDSQNKAPGVCSEVSHERRCGTAVTLDSIRRVDAHKA